MASFSIIENFTTKTNQIFLNKAAVLEPVLHETVFFPKRIVKIEDAGNCRCLVNETSSANALDDMELGRGSKLVIDFGQHCVGYISFQIAPVGCHYDAPAYLRLRFAEAPWELLDDSAAYQGWLSKSWIQEETLHFDILPTDAKLPRRYAFRYMQLEVIDTSQKYRVQFRNLLCRHVSAVTMQDIDPLDAGDTLLNQLDYISAKTLMDCMQSVFEDGPKRDRRLWLGDLRLQARTNYVTFKNYSLVKRCLYLFAGIAFEDGRVGACFFHEPDMQVDDTYLWDYALLFGPTLWDYYEVSGDRETLEDLYQTAMNQIDLCLKTLDENHVVIDKGDEFWCFLDWGEGLNKQAGAHAVLLYAIRYGIKLAEAVADHTRMAYLAEQVRILRDAAIKAFWDEEQGLFISGTERQVSWATQVWMVLARVFDQGKNRALLMRTRQANPDVQMITPYMYHHYIDALIRCGEKALALEEMKRYWGSMIQAGGDTFWELYDPKDLRASPYGAAMMNSYCHGWSCTPAYFLRKYYCDRGCSYER